MAHWHDFNPWATEIVYVPDLEEFALCIEHINQPMRAYNIDGSSEIMINTVQRNIANWKLCSSNRGGEGKIDAYILPQPHGHHSIGVRYGREGADYFSPLGNKERVQALLDKYRNPGAP